MGGWARRRNSKQKKAVNPADHHANTDALNHIKSPKRFSRVSELSTKRASAAATLERVRLIFLVATKI